jgi:hypothetical protein
MTSMSALLGRPLALEPVTEAVAEELALVFGLNLTPVSPSLLGVPAGLFQSGGMAASPVLT